MKEEDPFAFVARPDFSFNTDFTKWSEAEGERKIITVSMEFIIDAQRDTGLHKFCSEYLPLEKPEDNLYLKVEIAHKPDAPQEVTVSAGDRVFRDLKAQEVLKRLQTSRTFLFHSSAEFRPFFFQGLRGMFRDVSTGYPERLERSKKAVNALIQKVAKDQQQEVGALLGRLSERHKVGLTCPTFNLDYFPYNMTLGDTKVGVELDEWGSGTRNRTLILLTILKARQVAESRESASKVTPIIVIEEPESFLHPLAQAEFGRVLQELSDESRVQIIVTTHSPFLLSKEHPESNILLERRVIRGRPRETVRIDTSGERWMDPFVLSLGISSEEFRPWRNVFFTSKDRVLLVEGDTDREYFTLLRDPAHGASRLEFDGEILPYDGKPNLKNQTLLRFIKDRFYKVFITFDLDAEAEVTTSLQKAGFEKKSQYLSIGMEAAGKRCIEGLLPDSILNAVHAAHPDLVQALNGRPDERRQASQQLKHLYLERFKAEAQPGKEYYGHFYPIVQTIRKSLA